MHRIVATLLAVSSVACASSPPPESAAPPAASTDSSASAADVKDRACQTSSGLALSDLPEAGLEGALVLQPEDVACLERRGSAIAVVAVAAKDAPHLAVRLGTREGTTLLELHNGYPVTVHYRALLQVEGTAGWQETSIVAVRPGLSGFETWPHPIGALALFEFQFAAQESDRI